MSDLNKDIILIVDDEAMVKKALEAVLKFYFPHKKIILVGNGKEGLEVFKTHQPALILMDLQMPVMDGLQAFAELENYCKTNSIEMPFIIFFTAYAPSGKIKEIVDSSPKFGILQKPVKNDLLAEEIRKRVGNNN